MSEVRAHIGGNLWKLTVAVGDSVAAGQTVAIIESMKLEIPVEAEAGGVVEELHASEGAALVEGDLLVTLR